MAPFQFFGPTALPGWKTVNLKTSYFLGGKCSASTWQLALNSGFPFNSGFQQEWNRCYKNLEMSFYDPPCFAWHDLNPSHWNGMQTSHTLKNSFLANFHPIWKPELKCGKILSNFGTDASWKNTHNMCFFHPGSCGGQAREKYEKVRLISFIAH